MSMTNPTTTPDVATEIGVEYVHHVKRGVLTRLTWGWWAVDIDGPNVTVPPQSSAGKTTADLATLLGAAYTMIGTPIARGRGPLTPPRTNLPAPMIEQIVAVLRSAQAIAESHWHWRTFDVYECLGAAWEASEASLPHELLVATLRAALPANTTLADYTHRASAATIRTLFDAAIRIWRQAPHSARPGSPHISVA
jgi:hypothetical protein